MRVGGRASGWVGYPKGRALGVEYIPPAPESQKWAVRIPLECFLV